MGRPTLFAARGSAALYFGLLGTHVPPDDKSSVDNVSPGAL